MVHIDTLLPVERFDTLLDANIIAIGLNLSSFIYFVHLFILFSIGLFYIGLNLQAVFGGHM